MAAGSTPAPIEHTGSDGSGPVFRLPFRFGKYLLTKRLGVGGMAEVFLAQQDGPAGFAKSCVVKRILPHLAVDARFVRMFQAEAKLAALLSHSNIVQIFELGEIEGIHFISMEHVDGAPLHALARSAWRRGRSLPLEVVCCAIADAALGLQAAHDQLGPDGKPLELVHRDISPDNLMINREGITKVLDFGIAKSAAHEGRTATGELKGKIPFMSPEQIKGDPIDWRADLYALGVTFYWLLTGRRPITAPTELGLLQAILTTAPMPPRLLNDSVPGRIDELVMQLLEKDPQKRPQSAGEVYDVLAPALTARRSLVAPFVCEILDAGEVTGPEIDHLQTPGFLPSTPQVEEIRAAWHKLVLKNEGAVAPAVVVETASPPRRPLLWAFLTLLVVAIGLTAVFLSREVAPPVVAMTPTPTPTTTPPPPPPATTTTPQPTTPPTTTPPEPTPTTDPPPEPTPDTDPVGKSPRATPAREIVVAGPADIVWKTEKGKTLRTGPGSLKVPAGTKRIVAVQPKRGSRSVVAVADRVDFAALPHGKIQARASPFADVFLAGEALGTTPFPPTDVVAGVYVVRFVYEGREEKRTVEVKAGETVRVVVDFAAAP